MRGALGAGVGLVYLAEGVGDQGEELAGGVFFGAGCGAVGGAALSWEE